MARGRRDWRARARRRGLPGWSNHNLLGIAHFYLSDTFVHGNAAGDADAASLQGLRLIGEVWALATPDDSRKDVLRIGLAEAEEGGRAFTLGGISCACHHAAHGG